MAQEDTGQERTEDPTPKRLQDAKEKGQIPRSRELTTTLLMLGAAAAFLVTGNHMMQGLIGVFRWAFQPDRAWMFDPSAPFSLVRRAVIEGIYVVAPFALIMVIIALISPVLLGGWNVSFKAMQPDVSKMSPLKGLGRMFSAKSVIELVKAIAKVSVIGAVAVIVFKFYEQDFYMIAMEPLMPAMAHASEMFFFTFFVLSASLLIIAAIDVPFQIHDHTKQLKMTRQEIIDEYKETEGKPEVKSKIRQLQRQMSQARMMEDVPDADVIVTNPTHFAVALKYDQLNMRAPRVVAKGTDLLAARIREIAHENRVPLFEAPPLARALYHTSEIGDEVPGGLYIAVAQVLAYVYQMRRFVPRPGTRAPEKPKPEVPSEFEKYVNRGQ